MPILDFFGKTLLDTAATRNVFRQTDVVSGVVTGTSGNDAFAAPGGVYTLVGGAGDDRYYNVGEHTKVVERAGGGIDTVHLVSNYVMPDFVENAIVGYANGVVGNNLANWIVGTGMAQSFEGRGGDDVLTGGGGNDTFTFGAGSGFDVVTDFRAGSRAGGGAEIDTIRLTGYDRFQSFADVRAALTQVGSDTVLQLSATDAVKLSGVQLSDLTADNFQLRLNLGGARTSFADDFASLSVSGAGRAGTWRPDYGWGGDSNAVMARTLPSTGEKQLYVDSAMIGKNGQAVGLDPFTVKNGVLTIHADKTALDMRETLHGYNYTSGMLSTRDTFTQTYGYFEARMQLPEGQGAWPAFWLYTTEKNGSELDVMESHGNTVWAGTTHDFATGRDVQSSHSFFTPDLATGFHTYGVLWTEKTVTWYLDGVAVRTIDTPPDMHGPMYMIVNLAVDANVAADFRGADLQVDYVRAYTLDSLPQNVGGNGADPVVVAPEPEKPSGRVLWGGSHDDTFVVTSSLDSVKEPEKGGTDLVKASVDFTLPDHVENLTLLDGARTGIGNGLGNRIVANDLGDRLDGRAGNDTLQGGAGTDTLLGGAGNDTLNGKGGYDLIFGGDGNDRIIDDDRGGRGVTDGGTGTDTMLIARFSSTSDFSLNAPGSDTIFEGQIIRNVEQVIFYAGAGNDRLSGNNGADQLFGYGGNDTLNGGGGRDMLSGGTGNDRIDGGSGADTIYTGPGADTVILRAGEAAGDIVLDFAGAGQAGGDQLVFVGYGKNATLTQIGHTDSYVIDASNARPDETIRLVGVHGIDPISGHGDVLFV